MKPLRLGGSLGDGVFIVGIAALSAFSFPPIGLWILSLPAICLLLLMLRDRNPRSAANVGLLYGLVYGLGTMYWFFSIFSVLAILLIAIFAAYFGTLATLVSLSRGYSPFRRALLVGMFAVGVEWLRGDAWYLRFPWYTVPHALAQEASWIAPVRWLGTYGYSFALWFVAAWGTFARYHFWALFVLFPASSLMLPDFRPPDRTALLLQTEEKQGAEILIRNDKPISTKKVDLVVLPEYAYDSSPRDALASEYGPALLARRYGCPVVFGAREELLNKSNFYNVAAVIDANGNLLGTFPKQRPVPLFVDGISGNRRPVFTIPQGVLGVAVCYDFDAQEIAATLVNQGATVLVVPTFDAMRWGRTQHVHHELLLRLRALENDRWIVRCATSGRSEAVNPHGQPSQESVEIGKTGSVMVGFAYSAGKGYPLGGQFYLVGPAAAVGIVMFLLLFWMKRGRARWRQVEPVGGQSAASKSAANDGAAK